MNAVDPNELTMLMMTCIGVGITGSSNVRKRLPDGDAVCCGFKAEGDEGRRLPLQPRVTTPAKSNAGNASFMRMSLAASKANADRKFQTYLAIGSSAITSAVIVYA